jgi:ABC-type uncharacterized transport system permease subunit
MKIIVLGKHLFLIQGTLLCGCGGGGGWSEVPGILKAHCLCLKHVLTMGLGCI